MVAMVNDDRHSPQNNGSDVSRLAVLSFPQAGIQISAVHGWMTAIAGMTDRTRKSGL